MKSIREVRVKAVTVQLADYFNVLKDDGVISKRDVNEHDIFRLAKKIVDAIEIATVEEFELRHEAGLETDEGMH